MPRAIWTGIVTFGLVSIPVKLYAATESKDVAFHQLHNKCKTRIKEQRWCPQCERTVEWDEIEKGFEYSKGEYVVITPEDLQDLPVPSKKTISVESFVKLDQIDPVYFDKSYYLEPEESATKPFALFMNILKTKGYVGIGTVALRTKERYCSLRTMGGTLMVNTLLFPDEIRVDPYKELPHTKPSTQEMKMAGALVDMMATHFEPSDFKDNYREAIQAIVQAKLAGKETHVSSAHAKGGKVLDLMEALQASVENAKGSKKKPAAAASISKVKTKVAAHAEKPTRRKSTKAS